jgi:hypothetical protein
MQAKRSSDLFSLLSAKGSRVFSYLFFGVPAGVVPARAARVNRIEKGGQDFSRTENFF